MKKLVALLFSIWYLLLLAGCDTKKQDPPVEGVVRVCSSMNRNLSEALVEAFANKTGIVVEFDPLVATSLSQRLDLLGNSKVDVWVGGSAEEYYMAAERDMLVPYLPRGAANIPPQYMDRDGRWVPLSIDYIALLSNRNNIRKLGIEPPSSWDELLQPVLHNEIVMADPVTGGPPYGLITSLWQLRGREKALQYAGVLRTQQVLYLPTEAKAGYEVYLGNKAVAVLSLRHALTLEREHPFLYAAPVRDGNKNMITAAAILKNGEKRKEAELFMEYLFSKEAMQIMREYRINLLADALNDKNRYGDVGIVPNDDLRWMAGEKQALIREWLNAK